MADDNNENESAVNQDGGSPAEAASPSVEAVIGELEQALEASQAKAAEYLDGWQRARAEFTNYKRRVEKEQAETYQNATARVIARFLDISDDFDRAMQERPGGEADAAVARWVEGVSLIQRKLQAVLDAEGVTRMEVEGQAFDPQRHEAVTQEESPTHAPGQIIGVVRPGYKIGDRVIRPAMVRVAR